MIVLLSFLKTIFVHTHKLKLYKFNQQTFCNAINKLYTHFLCTTYLIYSLPTYLLPYITLLPPLSSLSFGFILKLSFSGSLLCPTTSEQFFVLCASVKFHKFATFLWVLNITTTFYAYIFFGFEKKTFLLQHSLDILHSHA